MKLYPKNINGAVQLQKEKEKLQQKLKATTRTGIFSLKSGNDKDVAVNKSNFMGIPGTSSLDLLLKILPVILGARGKKNKEKKKGGNIFVKVGFEFIGGYLKWKAVELAYKGARKLISSNKKKKEKRLP
jgi:hypothetical protein